MTANLVIFDCDGVLIDSEVIACRADSLELAEIGIEMSAEEVVRRFTGVSMREMHAAIETQFDVRLPDDFPSRVRRRGGRGLSNRFARNSGRQGDGAPPGVPLLCCVRQRTRQTPSRS